MTTSVLYRDQKTTDSILLDRLCISLRSKIGAGVTPVLVSVSVLHRGWCWCYTGAGVGVGVTPVLVLVLNTAVINTIFHSLLDSQRGRSSTCLRVISVEQYLLDNLVFYDTRKTAVHYRQDSDHLRLSWKARQHLRCSNHRFTHLSRDR